MTARVHDIDGREGGQFRVSLTYEAPDRNGKTSAHTDTYRGRFVRLLPDELVVEVDEFETADSPRWSRTRRWAPRARAADRRASGGHKGLGLVVADRDVEVGPVPLGPRRVHLLEPHGRKPAGSSMSSVGPVASPGAGYPSTARQNGRIAALPIASIAISSTCTGGGFSAV